MELEMEIQSFTFGSIQIDGTTYENDVVIDGLKIRKRDKKPSRKYRDELGHTPLSLEEDIPWKCSRLVIGTGAYGELPVLPEVIHEAKRRKIELVVIPTERAIDELRRSAKATNAILHLTC
jgi:hypothetical protein